MHLLLLNVLQLEVTTCFCMCVIFILHFIVYNDLFSKLELSVV